MTSAPILQQNYEQNASENVISQNYRLNITVWFELILASQHVSSLHFTFHARRKAKGQQNMAIVQICIEVTKFQHYA